MKRAFEIWIIVSYRGDYAQQEDDGLLQSLSRFDGWLFLYYLDRRFSISSNGNDIFTFLHKYLSFRK